MSIFGKKNKKSSKKSTVLTETVSNEKDTIAAIAAAIHLYFQEQHDFEKYVLTIKRIEKIYSPWSSKIYGLRKFPR